MCILFKNSIAYCPFQEPCRTTGNLTGSLGEVKRNELSLNTEVRYSSLVQWSIFLSYHTDPQVWSTGITWVWSVLVWVTASEIVKEAKNSIIREWGLEDLK